VKQLNNLPDIREDIIGPIKEKLDNGSYSVDSKSLAEKILSGGFNKKV
jgi:anti-sigma28 factor (negative regulator of flagellin synthesis)